jgi:hypothetical protein
MVSGFGFRVSGQASQRHLYIGARTMEEGSATVGIEVKRLAGIVNHFVQRPLARHARVVEQHVWRRRVGCWLLRVGRLVRCKLFPHLRLAAGG